MSGFLAYFLSIPGLVVLALLDATVLVFLPLAQLWGRGGSGRNSARKGSAGW